MSSIRLGSPGCLLLASRSALDPVVDERRIDIASSRPVSTEGKSRFQRRCFHDLAELCAMASGELLKSHVFIFSFDDLCRQRCVGLDFGLFRFRHDRDVCGGNGGKHQDVVVIEEPLARLAISEKGSRKTCERLSDVRDPESLRRFRALGDFRDRDITSSRASDASCLAPPAFPTGLCPCSRPRRRATDLVQLEDRYLRAMSV